MITGAHVILYSTDAEADRAFFRDVLGLKHVDAGHGWLIFALPPAELAVHPDESNGKHECYLLTDDVAQERARLLGVKVKCSEIQEERWGSIMNVTLPGGGTLGIYQPKHATAH